MNAHKRKRREEASKSEATRTPRSESRSGSYSLRTLTPTSTESIEGKKRESRPVAISLHSLSLDQLKAAIDFDYELALEAARCKGLPRESWQLIRSLRSTEIPLPFDPGSMGSGEEIRATSQAAEVSVETIAASIMAMDGLWVVQHPTLCTLIPTPSFTAVRCLWRPGFFT